MTSIMKKRIHVIYSGTVQGVGFRFTTRDIADNLNVQGWVKNLSDGKVEMTVEAEENILKKLLNEIKEYFKGYIEDEKIEWQKATGEFKSFDIVH